jgi:hypothetical protein
LRGGQDGGFTNLANSKALHSPPCKIADRDVKAAPAEGIVLVAVDADKVGVDWVGFVVIVMPAVVLLMVVLLCCGVGSGGGRMSGPQGG